MRRVGSVLFRTPVALAVAAAVLIGAGLASLPASASEDWSAHDVTVWLTRVSTDERLQAEVSGLIDEEGTVYVPLHVFFGPAGLADRIGVPWVLRDGAVSFPSGTGFTSLEVHEVDGRRYVVALEAVRQLGIPGLLVNDNRLQVSIW